jgi:hypothetical protein
MGLLDIFKKEKPSKDLKLFADKALEIFNEPLRGHGFKLLSKRLRNIFARLFIPKATTTLKYSPIFTGTTTLFIIM